MEHILNRIGVHDLFDVGVLEFRPEIRLGSPDTGRHGPYDVQVARDEFRDSRDWNIEIL